MSAIKRVSLSEQVLNSIVNYIQEHGLHVCDKLPTEGEFAELFQVSRTSVREAMKALSINGAVESIPGKGTFICTPVLNYILNRSENTVFQAKVSIAQIMEVRTALELLAADLAIERATDEEIAVVRKTLNDLQQAIASEKPWAVAGSMFNKQNAELSKNPLLLKNVQILSSTVAKYKDAMFAANTDMALYKKEHEKILDALCKRDKRAAHRAMIRHMEITEADILRLIDKNNASEFLNVE